MNFLLAFLLNLAFSATFLIFAGLAWLGNIFYDFPMVIVYVILGLWVLFALLVTAGIGVFGKNTAKGPHQKNINPYSKKTEDYIKDNSKNED